MFPLLGCDLLGRNTQSHFFSRVDEMAGRWRQQIADAVRVEKFPVLTWMLAGSCLAILYVVDLPNRKRQRLQREAEATLAKEGPPSLDVVRVLPNGKLLLRDGSMVSQSRE